MHSTRRFMFDNIESASEALATVLEDARSSEVFYRFSGLTPEAVLTTGLLLEGELATVAPKLEAVQGTISYIE